MQEYNKEGLKELLESQKKLLTITGKLRLHVEENQRGRNDYQRDYSRVMYSNSFRRLQGKMQLMPVKADRFNRNRLTHSLEVSQIARSIATRVGVWCKDFEEEYHFYTNDDGYVVETGAFAHDIGNPPFGHHGEKILNTLMLDYGGFEGNGQSLRNIMNIEKKFPEFAGLNLTLRSLLSIIKYNVPFNVASEKFLYRDEYNELTEALENNKILQVPRTIDAQIVDAADEIAYCAHDLEDALSQNYFSIDEFMNDLKRDSTRNKYPYKDEYTLFEAWVNNAKVIADKAKVYHSSEEYSFIFRKELTSIIVNELISDLDILSITELKEDFQTKTGTVRQNEIAFKHWRLVRGIKHCTFGGVNRTNEIQVYERLGTKVISGLFEALSDDQFNKDLLLLPVEYRSSKDDSEKLRYRRISDYIGGMMDTYAIDIYANIFGDSELKRIYDRDLYRSHKSKE